MEVYDKGNRYLNYFTTLTDKLRVCTYATVPVFIQSNAPSGNGGHNAQLSGTMDDTVGQPGPHVGRHQAMQNDKYGIVKNIILTYLAG